MGNGHLCQGGYNCFPLETEGYFYQSRPLRRAKCLAREFGGSCRGLALVEPLSNTNVNDSGGLTLPR